MNNKRSEQDMQEIHHLYLVQAKEEPPKSVDAEILALARKRSVPQATTQASKKSGRSPWIWSSAASVLLIVGLSLYWPELQKPAIDGPAMPEPVLMRSPEPMGATEQEALADMPAPSVQKKLRVSSEPGMMKSAEPAADNAMLEIQGMRKQAIMDNTELVQALQRLSTLVEQGKLADARVEYQALAETMARLPKEDPRRVRYEDLGKLLNQ
ncbi:hypothetical protein L2725_03740 [Shewanella corallii]|uniref:Anti-sigma factor n=1 Tax=Shewanella corallii TaxID=560080 RepID=A0ABT0N372_9GAMM|nr:hypothetical protein [Shewanella corallii]MCL2912897.1 hypothetical protein [Shewanella corallii]